MTTVVLANNVMASDSQITGSYTEHGFRKIYETDVGVYGFAGDPYNIEVFIKAIDALNTSIPIYDDDGEYNDHVKPEIVRVDTQHSDEDYSQCIFL